MCLISSWLLRSISFSVREGVLSEGLTRSDLWVMSLPVSSFGATSMRLTPVVLWPLRMVNVMGSAPRHSGRRLKWLLMMPNLKLLMTFWETMTP